MKIGIVYYGGYPWNRDIDLFAQSLKQTGVNPIIIANGARTLTKQNLVNDVPVVYCPTNLSNSARWDKFRAYHLPYNPSWKKWLMEMAIEHQLDGLIVRETVLAKPVLDTCKALGIKPYLDMRENLAAMYQMDYSTRWPSFLVSTLYHLVRFYEKSTVSKFEHIFTVTDEVREWVCEYFKVPGDKVTVIENTPSDYYLRCADTALSNPKPDDGLLRFVFAGYVEKARGLGDIVEALPLALAKEPRIRLKIIAQGDYLKVLIDRAKELEVEQALEIMPLLSMEELTRELTNCKVGLETCWLNEHTNMTMPGKIFEYMALGLPILSSPRRPVTRVLQAAKCGEIFESREPKALSDQMVSLIQNVNRLKGYSDNGRRAVLERFNWHQHVEVLNKVFGES